jgi:hypothetical protein
MRRLSQHRLMAGIRKTDASMEVRDRQDAMVGIPCMRNSRTLLDHCKPEIRTVSPIRR